MSGEAGAARRVLLLFVDGVGLTEHDPATNPLAVARLPALSRLLATDRPLTGGACSGPHASLLGLDACLGVPGLPQSGTGQAALLTGENTARAFGRHFGPWTPTALRPLVAERSVLARARAAGRGVAFANAYPEELMRVPSDAPRLPLPLRAGPVIAARGAGALTRHTPELMRGDAVASEIVNDGWRDKLRRDVPQVTAEGAGRTLARIAAAHDLTLYAHYATDSVGHERDLARGVAIAERLDAFLGAVVDAMSDDTLLIVASDHGNLEDVREQHTLNPALCLVAGAGRESVAGRLASIMDIAPAILGALGVD